MESVSLAASRLSCFAAKQHSKEAKHDKKSTMWKTIIDDVSVCVPAGQLMAIMGPSGSGKTTMLNLLAGRISPTLLPPGTNMVEGRWGGRPGTLMVSGDLRFNGVQLKNLNDVKNFSGYVMQHDHLMDFLTVEETITFASKLKLKYESKEEQQRRVEHVIHILALQGCRHTPIGGIYNKGISGGQKKRVSLAIELLSNPPLIFLDEPTSGLDSSLAFDVVRALRGIVNDGKTVVMTIHQPRSQIYALFDDLLLLVSGKTVYQGPAQEAVIFFDQIGYKCPENFNPADFFLDLVTPEGLKTTEAQLSIEAEGIETPDMIFRFSIPEEEIDQLPEKYGESAYGTTVDENLQKMMKEVGTLDTSVYKPGLIKRIQKWASTIITVCGRYVLNIGRNPAAFLFDLVVQTFVALFIGMVFYQMDLPDLSRPGCSPEIDHNVMGSQNSIIANLAFANIANVISIPNDRLMVNREKASGFYRPSAGFLGFSMSGLVFDYISPIIFGTVVYWMCGFASDAARFFSYIVLAMGAKYASTGFSNFVGAVVPQPMIAMVLAPLGNVMFMIVNGFMLADSSIPVWFIWLRYISYVRYSFQSLIENVVGGEGYLQTCMAVAENAFSMWPNFAMVLLIGTCWRGLAYLCVRFLYTRHGLQE